jgi:di/tricarboxylate transporter
MKPINRVLYGAFGAVGVAIGVSSLAAPGGVSPDENHLIRELGAAGIFIGLISFWCILNYAKRRGVHYALTVLAFLFAAIHWGDYFGGHRPLISPISNSVPLALLLLMIGGLRDARPLATIGRAE